MTYIGEGGIPDIRERLPREYGTATLDEFGNATITFANPAAATPRRFMQLTPWADAGDPPIVANPVSWVSSGGKYTGVVIVGQRLQALPNPLLTLAPLVGRRVWSSAAGAKIDWQLY